MNNPKLEQLSCKFPKLTEENQQYMLGLAEGIKHAQNNNHISSFQLNKKMNPDPVETQKRNFYEKQN
jgi:hypothetical protein